MPSSSVSFRITRQTEDLAETLHALSQRLVAVERRLEAFDEQLIRLRQQPREDPAEQAHLAEAEAHIERLLHDCRELLAMEPGAADAEPVSSPQDSPWQGGTGEGGMDLSQAA